MRHLVSLPETKSNKLNELVHFMSLLLFLGVNSYFKMDGYIYIQRLFHVSAMSVLNIENIFRLAWGQVEISLEIPKIQSL